MTSSTPLPPPTEEQMEALRMVLASAADRYETDPPVGAYLAVLAEGLEARRGVGLDGEERPEWRFMTLWHGWQGVEPVEEGGQR